MKNKTIFISGQIGIDPELGKLVSSNIQDETIQLMENIKAALRISKIDFSNVVKSSIYLTNIKELDIVNKIYASYFENDYPACEVFEATRLPLNANVEISMIATIE